MTKIDFDSTKLNSFYQEYLSVFEPCTDAPLSFILTTLLPSLAAVISLKRYIVWGSKAIYPNIWSLLIGPSTRLRKTTALSIGSQLNSRLQSEFPDRCFLLPKDGSLKGLFDALVNEKCGLLRYSEHRFLLSLMGTGFNIGMKAAFTDFFDVPSVHKVRLKNEETIITFPIFSIASATTLDWLRCSDSANDSMSGFSARFIYCYCDEKEKTIPIPINPDVEKIKSLSHTFDKILDLKPCPITYDKSFEEVYTRCYYQIEELLKNPFISEGAKTLLSRLQGDYFLKFVILECVLANTTKATAVEATRAAYLVDYYCRQAIVVMEKVLEDRKYPIEEKIVALIRVKGSVTTKELYQLFNNRISSKLLNPALRTLIECGVIECESQGKSKTYKLTSEITSINSEILQFSLLDEKAEMTANIDFNQENSQIIPNV